MMMHLQKASDEYSKPSLDKRSPEVQSSRQTKSVSIDSTHLPSPLITWHLDYIRLSTTVATNALLERKGHKHALLITKGFKDLLLIGNQSRPKIFDLNIRRPPPLYSTVLEVDERVTLVGYTSDPKAEEHAVQFDENGKVTRGYRGTGWDEKGDAEGPGEIVKGLSGEAVRIMKKPGTFYFLPIQSFFQPLLRLQNRRERPQETVRRGIQITRHRPCALLHIPRTRASRRKTGTGGWLHSCVGIRTAAADDQDGSSWGILHSGRIPDAYSTRLSGRIFQRI